MDLFHSSSLKHQRGSAIIFALGLSFLVVALSSALLLWLNLDIRRVEQLRAGSERLMSLQKAEALAAERIDIQPQDWEEPWRIDHEEFEIIARVEELSGRLNLNTIFAKEQPQNMPPSFMPKAVVTRLLENFQVEGAEILVDNLQAQGQPFLNLSQFETLKPAMEALYTAKPEVQQVNLNHTSAEILASILEIDPGLADSILLEKPFESQEQIIKVLEAHELSYDPITSIEAWLGFEGHYYLLETQFKGQHQAKIYSVLHKEGGTITLLWRSWGVRP